MNNSKLNSLFRDFSKGERKRKERIKNCKNRQNFSFSLGYAYRAPCPAENSPIFRIVFPICFYATPKKNRIDYSLKFLV